MNRCIMAVGAHADDIELNTGGTLVKYAAQGYGVVYVMGTNNMAGIVSELQGDGAVRQTRETPVPMMARRKRECDAGAQALGTTPIHLDHPQRHYNTGVGDEVCELRYGGALPAGVPANVPTILTAHEDAASRRRVVDLILAHDPECVFTHGISQVDMEHLGTALLVTRSYWEAVEAGFRGALLHWREDHTFLGEINCRWDTFVDCTPWLDRKMELIGLHRCQMPKAHLPTFGPRLRALRWGAVCGCGAAELFTWVRRADRRAPHGPVYEPLTLELIRNTR